MSISELIEKVEKSANKRSQSERFELLKEAHIIDESGNYDSKYFSKKTVEQDIKKSKDSKK